MKETSQPNRKYIRLPDVVRDYGLSKTKAYNLIKEGKIRSCSLREPGQAKATRLFCVKSLEAYIESFLPQEKEVPA